MEEIQTLEATNRDQAALIRLLSEALQYPQRLPSLLERIKQHGALPEELDVLRKQHSEFVDVLRQQIEEVVADKSALDKKVAGYAEQVREFEQQLEANAREKEKLLAAFKPSSSSDFQRAVSSVEIEINEETTEEEDLDLLLFNKDTEIMELNAQIKEAEVELQKTMAENEQLKAKMMNQTESELSLT